MNKYVVWFEQAEIGIRFDDSKKFLIAIFDLHLFTDENPVIDFNGIDPMFLDATDVKRINELSQQEKSVYITKLIECCQYLHNRAIQQEREDRTIHCVWNIQVWCKYGLQSLWWLRMVVSYGKGLLQKNHGRPDYPIFKFSMQSDHM